MGDILSQSEVNSLLSGLTGEDVESDVTMDFGTDTEEEDYDESVAPYDFSSQDRVIRGRMPTLEIITERFSRMFRANLSAMIRRVVDIEVASVDMVKFAEFHNSLPVPSSIHIFRMEPLRGHKILVFESQLAYNLIESYFGGQTLGHMKIEGREFTNIETRIVEKMVHTALKDLDEAWKPIYKINPNYIRSEVNPKFAAIVLPTDLVVVIRFALDIEGIGGFMILCIPYASIESIRNLLYASVQTDESEGDDSIWKNKLHKSTMDLSVDLTIELGSTKITTEKLMSLEVGDVIVLDQSPSEPFVGKVGKIPKFLGIAGIRQGNKSFRIDSRVTPKQKKKMAIK
jgi:flagellar motor switch protein FliM